MPVRQATVVGVGVGVLLAIAVATIDGVIAARLMSRPLVCPDPACTRAAAFGGNAERAQVLMAFVVGFAAAFGWFVRRPKAALLAVSGGTLLALAVMTIDAVIAGRLLTPFPCPSAACARVLQLFEGMFEGTDVLIAFVLGFAVAFAWFVHRPRRSLPEAAPRRFM